MSSADGLYVLRSSVFASLKHLCLEYRRLTKSTLMWMQWQKDTQSERLFRHATVWLYTDWIEWHSWYAGQFPWNACVLGHWLGWSNETRELCQRWCVWAMADEEDWRKGGIGTLIGMGQNLCKALIFRTCLCAPETAQMVLSLNEMAIDGHPDKPFILSLYHQCILCHSTVTSYHFNEYSRHWGCTYTHLTCCPKRTLHAVKAELIKFTL